MNSQANQPIPPTIPDSSNYDSNYNEILQVNNVESDYTTDNVLIIENGKITNLIGPIINDTSAVPISYVKTPASGGILYSVQFNNLGFFDGSPNLLFNNDILTLNGNFSSDGVLITKSTTGSDIIFGLEIPLLDSNAVNLNYANQYIYSSVTSITSNSVQVYSAKQLINGYIKRNCNTVISDITTTATNIVNYLNSKFGTTVPLNSRFYFAMLNDSTSGTLSLVGGTGVTITPNTFVVNPNYILNSTLIVTNNTPLSEAILINIDSIYIGTNYISSYFVTNGTKTSFTTQFPYKIDDVLLLPSINSSTVTSTSYTYTVSDINSGLVIRDPTANSVDTFVNTLTDENSSFIIQNISAFDIVINSSSNWTFSPITLSTDKIGYFYITIETTNSYVLTSISIS